MSCFVRPRARANPSLRLIAFHHAGGSAAMYHPISAGLPADWRAAHPRPPGPRQAARRTADPHPAGARRAGHRRRAPVARCPDRPVRPQPGCPARRRGGAPVPATRYGAGLGRRLRARRSGAPGEHAPPELAGRCHADRRGHRARWNAGARWRDPRAARALPAHRPRRHRGPRFLRPRPRPHGARLPDHRVRRHERRVGAAGHDAAVGARDLRRIPRAPVRRRTLLLPRTAFPRLTQDIVHEIRAVSPPTQIVSFTA